MGATGLAEGARCMEQLGLFEPQGPKALACYTLRDWDVDACQEARDAWARANPQERLEWCNVWCIQYPDTGP